MVSVNNILVVTIVILSIIIIIIIAYVFNLKKRSKAYTEPANNVGGQSKSSVREREREKRRREREARRIEEEIKQELNNQRINFSNYIHNLEMAVTKSEKKIFFNLNRNSVTNPSGLFNKLRNIFDIDINETIYYCRRNNTVFGADDFFIITSGGFSYGDSNGSKGILEFDAVNKLELTREFVYFKCYSEIIDETLYFDDIVYFEEDIQDFVDVTNEFLKEYLDPSNIYAFAALEASEVMAIPLLEYLRDKLEEKDFKKDYVNALYYYCLAKDGVNISSNLQRSGYFLNDFKKKCIKICEDYEIDLHKYYGYGLSEILRAKIELLNGEDHYEISKRLKNILCDGVDPHIREAVLKLNETLKME